MVLVWCGIVCCGKRSGESRLLRGKRGSLVVASISEAII